MQLGGRVGTCRWDFDCVWLYLIQVGVRVFFGYGSGKLEC